MMNRDASHLLGRFGARAFFVAIALACACLLLGAVRPALAEEDQQASGAGQGVTHSVEGVNYTIPADWQALPIPQAIAPEIGMTALEAYTHEDGFFAAAAIPGSVEGANLEEAQDAAADINEEFAELEYLPGMTGLPIEASAALEQGWPTLTLYTDDIVLNGVTYGLTAKLFLVSDGSFEGVVAMASFLPASGVVTEDFAHSFPVLEQEQTIDVAGAPYVVPAGSTLAQGSVFGIDFACAWRDVAVMVAIDLPLVGADEVTVDMLDELAYSLAESTSSAARDLDAAPELLGGRLPGLWPAYARCGGNRRPHGCRLVVLGLDGALLRGGHRPGGVRGAAGRGLRRGGSGRERRHVRAGRLVAGRAVWL